MRGNYLPVLRVIFHILGFVTFKPRLVVPFCYQLTLVVQLVLGKRPLNGCNSWFCMMFA